MPTLQQSYVQRMYQPIVGIFFLLAALIFTGVVYAGLSKTVITVTTIPQPLHETITVTIGPKDNVGPLYLHGTVTTTPLSETVTAKPSGEGPLVPAHAHGTVTFHNTSTKSQPLSAGTRLQADNGVIVRTTNRVDIAPGSTVHDDAVADPLGDEGNVVPGRFVIVALWPGLQDKIYATSDQAFTGGSVQQSGGLSLTDLTTASDQAEKNIRQKLGQSFPGALKQLAAIDVVAVPPANQPSDTYAVTVNMKATTVTYSTDQLNALIQAGLNKLVPTGQTLKSIDRPILSIDSQPTDQEVVVTITAKGLSELSPTSPVFQTTQFIGLDQNAIVAKLSGTSAVKDIRLRFSPPWRTVAPNQPDQIKIIIKSSAS